MTAPLRPASSVFEEYKDMPVMARLQQYITEVLCRDLHDLANVKIAIEPSFDPFEQHAPFALDFKDGYHQEGRIIWHLKYNLYTVQITLGALENE